MILQLLVYLIGFNPQPTQVTVVEQPVKAEVVQVNSMVSLINEERSKIGALPLTYNYTLEKSATVKACDLRDNNYWSHDRPNGEKWYVTIANAGYDFVWAGENLTRDYETDELAMQALMDSPEHRDNILKSVYREVGIGRCGSYTVQHFGAK